MKQNHYETLGVAPTASFAEVRAAYRRQASRHHPDREGGDPIEMQAINRANDVLSDPAKRARYDQTGEDTTGPTPTTMARDLLVAVFENMLDAGHARPLAGAIERLKTTGETIKRKRREVGRALVTMNDRLDLITVEEGPNLFAELVAKRIDRMKRDIAAADEAIAVHDLALEMLTAYRTSEKGMTAEEMNRAAYLAALANAEAQQYGSAQYSAYRVKP